MRSTTPGRFRWRGSPTATRFCAGLFGILAIWRHSEPACRNRTHFRQCCRRCCWRSSLAFGRNRHWGSRLSAGTGDHARYARLAPRPAAVVAALAAWSSLGAWRGAAGLRSACCRCAVYRSSLVIRWLLSNIALNGFPVHTWAMDGFPPEVAMVLSPRSAALVWWTGVAMCAAGVCCCFLPLLRRSRVARFWGLGTLLAAIPMCSAAADESAFGVHWLGGDGAARAISGGIAGSAILARSILSDEVARAVLLV